MQALFGFIQKLCALVMISLLADLLMPSGAMRKYVRLACGMLVLHIMVSQVFVLFGRGAPDVAAQEWTQLVGEMQALPGESGVEAALSAYQRQAEQLILEKARSLGMADPVVSIAWDSAHQVSAVILREREASVAAGAKLGAPAASSIEPDYGTIRLEMARTLGLPVQAVLIQKEGSGGP